MFFVFYFVLVTFLVLFSFFVRFVLLFLVLNSAKCHKDLPFSKFSLKFCVQIDILTKNFSFFVNFLCTRCVKFRRKLEFYGRSVFKFTQSVNFSQNSTPKTPKQRRKFRQMPEFYGRSPFCYGVDKAKYCEAILRVVRANECG